MLFPKRQTKRQRLAAIMAEIDVDSIRELPEEAEATTSEIGVAKSVTIVQDGQELHGTGWTLPSDYDDDDTQHNRLPMLKGTTPLTLPTLDDDQADDPTTHFARNDFPIS